MTNKGTEVYTAAISAWSEQYGSFVFREKLWRYIAIGCLMITGASVVGIVYIASQNQTIPYIVEIDASATPVNVTKLTKPPSPTAPQIKATLARWIENLRTVTHDTELQRKAINDTYAHLTNNSQATNRISAHFRKADPFRRSDEELVRVTVLSVLLISKNSWRVRWTERIQDAQAQASPQTLTYAANLTITHGAISEKMIYSNPLGLFVTNIDWQKEAELR